MDTGRIMTSVVIPLRNEEAYIEQCLQSLLRQDYPADQLEVLLVDGMSTDRTCAIIEDYSARYPYMVLLNNPHKTVPFAMNIGIRAARGRYIVRLDAHSAYADNYITKCIEFLEKTGADNVGGVAETRGEGFWGSAIALMLSSRFGVGNSAFRIGAEDGYVDTVPFGAFRREVFEKYGYYDERLTRNQDNEMNYRIRKNGGKIYLTNEIKLTYFSRSTIRGIAKMAFQNGKWNVITSFLCPGTMGVRHFVPFAFVLSLLLWPLAGLLFNSGFFLKCLALELALYLCLNIGFSLAIALKNSFKYFLALLLLFPLFHICYGWGSLAGLLKQPA